MAIFYDTHAHLDYPEFQSDFAEIMDRAEAAGITRMISIGTNLESSRRAVQLARQYPQIYAAVGWHPGEAESAPGDIRPELYELAKDPKVVAIGETGLDYYRLPSSRGGTAEDDAANKARQAQLFAQQMEVAAEAGLNCVIHQRASLEDTLTQLELYSSRLRGVFHCFTEIPAVRERIAALGSMVSYTGILTFKNAETVRDSLRTTPLGEFMLETDAPYLAPLPFRGKRCEPAHVKETALFAADVLKVSLEDLSAATCAAAHRFFPKLGDR